MRALVAMSGGVDSSVAAALLAAEGHHVVGVTLKLWGGPSDQGCCSVSDVDDARRVADHLGIDHHVFNYADAFDASVVAPYVDAHAAGRTPNPCIECNRHVKFDLLHRRAVALGFDVIATGHHARVARRDDGPRRVARGADAAKDQSYVLYMLDQAALARTHFPVGALTKDEVRATAARLGLRTAAKPDSQDVCFIGAATGRAGFLVGRVPLTPGRIVDVDGAEVGEVDAIQLVTIGQRKGLGLAGGSAARYVVHIDRPTATVTVGPPSLLHIGGQRLTDLVWSSTPVAGHVLAQCSAHGPALPAVFDGGLVTWREPQRRVAPGQAVVLYDPAAPDEVLGGGTAIDEVVPARR